MAPTVAEAQASQSESDAPFTTSSLFALIHDLHATITTAIDSSLTWDQLNSPPVNYSLVRPIISRIVPPKDEKKAARSSSALLSVPAGSSGSNDQAELGASQKQPAVETCLGAVLFALMANRLQFLSLADGDLSYAPLQTTRAAFCELLAIKLLRTFPQAEDEAQLAGELVRGFCAFDGAPNDVWEAMGDDRSEVEESHSSALELAIVTTSKHFLSTPIIQHIIHQIYVGNLVYAPSSARALISDIYISDRTKRRRLSHNTTHRPLNTVQPEELTEVYPYNPYEAGWLDHGRLRVPKWRKWFEFGSFALLIILFVNTLTFKDLDHITVLEVIFIIFTAGFALDEFATSQEHGWTVYSANAWNVFDMTFILFFLLYFVLRMVALSSHSPRTSDLAFDILACGACILFPRLVFFLIKDNVVILALRAMIVRFVKFMALVIVAFSGILFCLWTLGRGTWTVRQIAWLMAQIWFGSSYLGFSASESFHPIFGPIILISYAALCSTLLITILISILSNEFAEINANAEEEHMFQRVVKTVEGVKSDSIFSYLPPVNIIAFVTLGPLSFFVSPRTLHRINVFGIRLTSFPFLFAISAYERYQYRSTRQIRLKSGDYLQRGGIFDAILGGGSETIISSVFQAGPPIEQPQTPPTKISSVAGPSVEADDDEPESNPAGSPLAKIWGISGSRQAKRKSLAAASVNPEEVQKLKEEIKEMRESQLRMEEMLAKALGGGSK